MNANERKLLELFRSLSDNQQESIIAFSRFLFTQSDNAKKSQEIETPKAMPRPENESVIAAIKRLSESYHMINKDSMLHETSGIMTQHIMHGKEAEEVIDELEALFQCQYQNYVNQMETETK